MGGTLGSATTTTLQRLIVGTIAGVVPGLVLGLLMGLFRTPRAIINPLVSAVYPLPRIALFPLVLGRDRDDDRHPMGKCRQTGGSDARYGDSSTL